MSSKATSSSFLVISFLACICLFGQGCQEYVSEPLPPQGDGSCCLMVIVHGSGSSPDDWPLELENAIDARLLRMSGKAGILYGMAGRNTPTTRSLLPKPAWNWATKSA